MKFATTQELIDLHDALEHAAEEQQHILDEREDVKDNYEPGELHTLQMQVDRWVDLRDKVAPYIADVLQERDQ